MLTLVSRMGFIKSHIKRTDHEPIAYQLAVPEWNNNAKVILDKIGSSNGLVTEPICTEFWPINCYEHISIVLFHNNFPPSGEQPKHHKLLLAYEV